MTPSLLSVFPTALIAHSASADSVAAAAAVADVQRSFLLIAASGLLAVLAIVLFVLERTQYPPGYADLKRGLGGGRHR